MTNTSVLKEFIFNFRIIMNIFYVRLDLNRSKTSGIFSDP